MAKRAFHIVKRNPFRNLPEKLQGELRWEKYLAQGFTHRFQNDQTIPYNFRTGRLLPHSREELIQRKGEGPGSIRFLDAGAGLGEGLHEAEELGGIRAFGIGLTPPERPKHRSHWVRRRVEESAFSPHFDVIQSTYALLHAANHAVFLENLLNGLRKPSSTRRGGVLIAPIFDIIPSIDEKVSGKLFDEYHQNRETEEERKRKIEYRHPVIILPRLVQELALQGFKVSDLAGFKREDDCVRYSDRRQILAIRRTSPSVADLSAFYDHPGFNRYPIAPDGFDPRGKKRA